MPGVEPVGSRIRLFPTYPLALDRGDIAVGGGADGERERVPPPLSPRARQISHLKHNRFSFSDHSAIL